MKIKGIGTDIVSVKRIEAVYKKHGRRFFQRIFTDLEMKEILDRGFSYETIAGKFAGKEAVIKCVGIPFNLKSVEILHNSNGSPYVSNFKNVLLSISHEKEFAVAFAVSMEEEK